jgi:hypothetical protein
MCCVLVDFEPLRSKSVSDRLIHLMHHRAPAKGGVRTASAELIDVALSPGRPVRVRYRPRSDKELSHPSPVAIEMRWKIPLLPPRRD